MSAVVFCGPTLPAREVAELAPEAELRPPAAMGDVCRAVAGGARVVGLIDGFFELVPAVWHKEVLWALDRGAHVLGAASMGALRAAELHRYGMVGIGRVFADLRDEVLTDDDEVAVVHALDDGDYLPLSEAMVNIRATLARAAGDGVLEGGAADRLVAAAKARYYSERTWAAVLDDAREVVGLGAAERLARWLPEGRVDQKRLDALDLLAELRTLEAADAPAPPVTEPFVATRIWQAALAEIAPGDPVGPDRVHEELVLDPGRGARLRDRAVLRWAAGAAAAAHGWQPDPARLAAATEELARRVPHLDADRRAELARGALAEEWVRTALGGSLRERMLDQARVGGEHAALAARAAAKDVDLRRTGRDQLSARDQGYTEADLLRWWYRTRQGAPVPRDASVPAAAAGVDRATFLRALRRERAHVDPVLATGTIPAPRAHLRVEGVLGPVEAELFLDAWKASGPFVVSGAPSVHENAEDGATATAGRPGTLGGRDDGTSDDEPDLYLRRLWASGRRVLVPGVEPLLWSTRLRDAARRYSPEGTVLEPAFVTLTVVLPGQQLSPHYDGASFRGLDRASCPGWLLLAAQYSGLFERWRVPLVSAVYYPCDHGRAGSLLLWERGAHQQPTVVERAADLAVVTSVDVTAHAAARLDGGPVPPGVGPGARLRHLGRDRWIVEHGDRAVATYRSEDLRVSVAWGTYAFPDRDAHRAWAVRSDPLTTDVIVATLHDALRERGLLDDAPTSPQELAEAIVATFVSPHPLPTMPDATATG